MKIGVITKFTNFEIEDSIIELLTRREFYLFSRVSDKSNLLLVLGKCESEKRYLIICDDSLGLNNSDLKTLPRENIAVLELNRDDLKVNEDLFEIVYERLRQPEKAQSNQVRQPSGNWIGFTGSSASPGISTLALNVSAEISLSQKITLVDADAERRDLMFRLGLNRDLKSIKMNDNLTVIDWNEEQDPLTFQDMGLVDLGSAPDLKVALSDRRSSGKSYAENLQSCASIIFVSHPENHSINQMRNFSRQISEIFPEIKVSYVLNKAGTSARHLAFKKSFKSQVEDPSPESRKFIVPADYSAVDRAQGRFGSLLESAPRSAIRRAVRELAIYLGK
jgi:hypothetical protein